MVEPTRRGVLALGGVALAGEAVAAATAFDHRLEALEGGPLDLNRFRGRPLLVANTASFCGYTPQYAGLQRVHARFAPRGLVVLGVPSNSFNQESGDAARIRQFCEVEFGVEFPMAAPVEVRGPGAHPLFAWLAARGGGPPRWNFHKYLVGREGLSVQGFPTRVEPEAPELLRAIEAALTA